MAGSRRLTSLSAEVLQRFSVRLPAGPLVVALSGGADSAVCAWAAAQEREAVRAVHVDHGWPASTALRSAAEKIAARLGIDIAVIHVDAPSGPSPEGQARSARYAALAGQMLGDEFLLTGHTWDDQAETVLGNLLRGAGSSGLAGIPARRGNMVRPMLEMTRSEVRELATLLGLPWMDDPANEDNAFRRNALRRDIIPYLEARMNMDFRGSLVRMAAALRADDGLLDDAADTVPLELDGDRSARLPAPLLNTLPAPLSGRAVRRAIRALSHGYPGSSAGVAAVLSVAGGGPAAQLSGSIRVERRGVWVVLEREAKKATPSSASWTVPGTAASGDWTLQGWIEEHPPPAFPMSHFVEVFDADLVPDSFTVRPLRRGDRIAIVGGSKPVAETLAEADIPKVRRSEWPVVVAGNDVLWVPGVRRAATGWVGAGTNRYLWVCATVEGNP